MYSVDLHLPGELGGIVFNTIEGCDFGAAGINLLSWANCGGGFFILRTQIHHQNNDPSNRLVSLNT